MGRTETHYTAASMMDEYPTYFVSTAGSAQWSAPGPFMPTPARPFACSWAPDRSSSPISIFIGDIFNNVYEEGALGNTSVHDVQTTVVPAGGSTIVEFSHAVTGTYVFVDHSMSHMDRGAMGQLVVDGAPNPDLFSGDATANTAESK